MKKDLTIGVASLDGESLVVFYYLVGSEIWRGKRGGIWCEWPYKWGTAVLHRMQ